MPLNPGRTCPHILTTGRRAGEVCGQPGRPDGFCQNHGPGGRLEQNQQEKERRRTEGKCQKTVRHGPRAGQVCGRPTRPGMAVCHKHDPAVWAKKVANRENPCKATYTDGGTCDQPARPGLDVCHRHGGMTPAAAAKSKNFVRQRDAAKTLARLGINVGIVANPYVALQHHAAQLIAWRDHWLAQALALKNARYRSDQDLEQIRGEIQIYQKAAQDATVALSALARMQVDEHLAAIDAATKVMLITALRDALSGAGVDPSTAQKIKTAFADGVQVIEGSVLEGGITPGETRPCDRPV